jgi:hypothetical protein
MPPLNNRFEVRMTDELAKEFEEIQRKTGLNGAEVFRRAIAVYGIVKPAQLAGERITIVSKDKEKELVSI